MIKLFENFNEHKVPIGNYVVCHIDSFGKQHDKTNKFFNENIGKLTKINYDTVANPYLVEFDKKIPGILQGERGGIGINIIWLYRIDIIYHAPNKEDLEIYIQTKKYNI